MCLAALSGHRTHMVTIAGEARVSTSTTCKSIVLSHLGRAALGPPRRPTAGSPETRESGALRRDELASARFLSVREAPGRWIAALTIEDQLAERYFAVYHLAERPGTGWQLSGAFRGPDRPPPSKPDPFLSLGAFCAEDVFFAGGRLQGEAKSVTRVELAWEDGETLSDTIENGVALFLGHRGAIDPATVTLYRADGSCIATHRALIDEP
jgi:hypothetical protein